MKTSIISINIFVIFFISACGFLHECGKTIWGSSTRALETARASGIRDTFPCSSRACFDAVLDLTYTRTKTRPDQTRRFQLFQQNRAEGHIVVMNVPGSVDTTEVGIFFDAIGQGQTQVEIASLSSAAASTTAEIVFAALQADFIRDSGESESEGDQDD